MHYTPTPTEDILEIQGEVNVSGEESAASEANHVCICTPTHPSIPSLSSSYIISYIS